MSLRIVADPHPVTGVVAQISEARGEAAIRAKEPQWERLFRCVSWTCDICGFVEHGTARGFFRLCPWCDRLRGYAYQDWHWHLRAPAPIEAGLTTPGRTDRGRRRVGPRRSGSNSPERSSR